MTRSGFFNRPLAAGLLVALTLLISTGPALAGWQLVWNDEFNGTNLDSTKWTNDIGNGFYIGTNYISGWGNNELEYYTARPENLTVSNGMLHLFARQESYAGYNYTSARINTAGRFTTTYGRIEFRARFPQGGGYWPALWLMPENSTYGTWPASGEIDVTENKGSIGSTIYGTLHYGSVGNDVYNAQSYVLPNSGSVTNFHIYRIDWSTNTITWFVDGIPYQTLTNWFTSGGAYPAPFSQPFHLIINLSVGGNYLGNPGTNSININTPFPGEEQVDYVRVYQATPGSDQLPVLNIGVQAGQAFLGGSNGFPNAAYNLLATTNLVQPPGNWPVLTSKTFDPHGNCLLTNSIGNSTMYYRLAVP